LNAKTPKIPHLLHIQVMNSGVMRSITDLGGFSIFVCSLRHRYIRWTVI